MCPLFVDLEYSDGVLFGEDTENEPIKPHIFVEVRRSLLQLASIHGTSCCFIIKPSTLSRFCVVVVVVSSSISFLFLVNF